MKWRLIYDFNDYFHQIECGKPWSPPLQCTQYHTGLAGTIKSWNFDDSTNIHNNDMAYAVCLRREKGYCGFSVIPANEPFSFVWDRLTTRGESGEICRTDNINIPGTSLTGRGVSTERYCGYKLTSMAQGPYPPTTHDRLVTYRTPFR